MAVNWLTRCFWVTILLGCCAVLTLQDAKAQQARIALKGKVAPARCGSSRLVRDYLKPLSKMTPIRQVPASGKLPFGPAGLNLNAGGQLVVGPGSAGFSISDEAIGQRRKLNWLVEATLSKVNGQGRVLSDIESIRRRLGAAVQGNSIKNFAFDLSSTPAYYRVDIRFQTLGSSEFLGEFSQYVRVMKPRTEVLVAVDAPVVTVGQTVHASIFNAGTTTLESPSYDFGFRVQRFDDARWRSVPENPRRGPVPKPIQFLGAGTENRGCLRYLVPADQPLGKYRFSSALGSAEFEVVAPPAG